MAVSKITKIHSFLVKPLGGHNSSGTIGTEIDLNGKLYDLLANIFLATDDECKIDIAFNTAADGSQDNPSRDLFVGYLKQQDESSATIIAHKLELCTTKRSGSGLLFLIAGEQDGKNKLVLSRFPADVGISADEKNNKLSVEFIDKVFMKNAKSYKAVAFKNLTTQSTERRGKAIDKQINDVQSPTSEYWIKKFLDCDFLVTSAAGTRRLADALKNAVAKSDDLALKAQVAGLASVMPMFEGKVMSAENIINSLSLHPDAVQSVREKLGAQAMSEAFKFDKMIFSNHFKYRSKVLDNGAILTAEASEFDEVYEQTSNGSVTTFKTTGSVVKETVGKRGQGSS